MKGKINKIQNSLEEIVKELYSMDKDIHEWNQSCDFAETIRNINAAINRLNNITQELNTKNTIDKIRSKMPEIAFIDYCLELKHSSDDNSIDVAKLANHFNVSVRDAFIRGVELKLWNMHADSKCLSN